jgi:tetratricopeptide (TPR) repeat protein
VVLTRGTSFARPRARSGLMMMLVAAIALAVPSSTLAQKRPRKAPAAAPAAPVASPAEPALPAPAAPEQAPVVESKAAEAAKAPSDAEQMRSLDEEARERFELGRSLYNAGRFQQAAEEFGEAYKLSGRPQLLYNLYVANRDAANWEPAIDALRGYLDKVPDAPDAVNLRARLASLELQAAQQKQQREEQALAEAALRKNQRPATRLEKTRSIVPYVLLGSGGALLVGSIITGVMAKSKAGDLDKVCAQGGSVCPSWQKGDVDSTRTLAITTDVLWSVGAATAITGAVLWFTGKLDSEREVPVALNVTPHGVSSSLTVRY